MKLPGALRQIIPYFTTSERTEMRAMTHERKQSLFEFIIYEFRDTIKIFSVLGKLLSDDAGAQDLIANAATDEDSIDMFIRWWNDQNPERSIPCAL